jgi:protein involved in polysaccharide export with SLBB domain
LASGYVRAPKVTAYVFKYRNFYVTGEVKTPGGYPYEEGLSVQKAITLAGGMTEKAERNDLRVVRQANGHEETVPVKIDNQVQPDDVIVVAEAYKFYISGEVKTPGRYLYEKGMSVHKALSLGGGPTEKAEKYNIRVIRITAGLAETTVVTGDATLLPDDILVIEPQSHKFFASGEVKNPGGYPYKEGLTVHKAIAMAGGLTEKAQRGDPHILRSVHGQEETLPVKLDTQILPDDIIVVAEGQKFYITGEVKTPGRYLYETGMTIHKAISLAGGWTEKAEKGIIKVTRVGQDLTTINETNLDAQVLPDDFIVIPQLYKVYVNGEVKKAGDYPYEKGLTIHKVITMAGGFTDKASESWARVLRVINGQQESIRMKLEDIVLPEDIIVVPRRFF